MKQVHASAQIADIFTKRLSRPPFFDLRFKLGVELPPATSLRGCIEEPKPIKTEALILESKAHKIDDTSPNQVILSSSTVLSNGKKIEPTVSQCTAKQRNQIQLANGFDALGPRAVTCY